jgi:hypothetical protein
MNLLKCGDNVVVIEDGELRNGVIKTVFDMITPPMYAVEFEDGIEKVPFNRVAPAPKTETPEEQKREPVFKSEITITPDEFQEISCRVVAEETKDNIFIGLTFSTILAKIHKALFLDEGEQ